MKQLKTLTKLAGLIFFSPIIAIGFMLLFSLVVVAEIWDFSDRLGETESEKNERLTREWNNQQ
jgi:hypothetical protein